MLELRVLTAAVLAPLVVLAVLMLSVAQFALLLGLVVAAAAWEWAILCGCHRTRDRTVVVTAVCVLLLLAYVARVWLSPLLLILACVFWLWVGYDLWRHRRRAPIVWPPAGRTLAGMLVLISAWLAVVELQAVAPQAALMLFLLVWAADTGAYFAGRRWGRHRLAPAISPGKTLQGAAGGGLAALPVAGAFAAWWQLDAMAWVGLLALSVLVAGFSIAGDLFESNWKRLASIKDSGGLLPGHGGVLDRIDGLTAAAPFFALGWFWWFRAASA